MTGHFFGHEFFKSYSILFFSFSKNVDFMGLLRGHFMLFNWLSYAGHDVIYITKNDKDLRKVFLLSEGLFFDDSIVSSILERLT